MIDNIIIEALKEVNISPDLSGKNVIEEIENKLRTRCEPGDTESKRVYEDWRSAESSVDYDWSEGKTLLHYAAKGGHINVANALIERGAAVDIKDKKNKTPVHHAAENNYVGVLKLLIEVLELIIKKEVGAKKGKGSKKRASIDGKDRKGKAPLHYAVKNNCVEAAELLVQSGVDIAVEDWEGKTALHYAAENGCLDIVKLLIKNGAKINKADRYAITPLHEAARNGHKDVLELLLASEANVGVEDRNKKTPLHYAVEKGHLDIVRLLIENGADIDARDIEGKTPLHIAAANGYKDIIELIIKERANFSIKDNEGKTPKDCCTNEHIIQLLAEAEQQQQLNKKLFDAVERGNVDEARKLVESGAEINAKDKDKKTLLHYAATNGCLDIAKLLIKNGVKVNEVDKYAMTPLHKAAENGHKDILEFLIENGAEVEVKDIEGRIPLHIAAENGHLDVIQILIDKANVQDGFNRTPLYLAAENGHKDAVKLLSKYTDLANVSGETSCTVLHSVVGYGDWEILKLILENGVNVDIDTKDIRGRTPLHYASRFGYEEIVKLLLEYRANPLLQDFNGQTPRDLHSVSSIEVASLLEGAEQKQQRLNEELFNAVKKGKVDEVSNLIKSGADVNAKDKDGRTSLHEAASGDHEEIIKLLLEHGANIDAINSVIYKPAQPSGSLSTTSIAQPQAIGQARSS